MDANTFAFVSRILTIMGWCISLVVWLGYTAVAPWYKIAAGRYIWGLLTSIMLLLSVTISRFLFPGLPFRQELILFALIAFNIAMLSVGVGIYKAQILRYYKAKFVQKEREKNNR